MNRLAPQLVFVTLLSVAGCKQTEPNYCEDVPVTHNCMDKIDADTSCSSNAQCSGATPVCDVGGAKACVQCTTTDATACSGATPVCGTNNTCERCTMHAQCSSNVCLPDGSCSDGVNVAYVTANGSGSTCTKAMPCGTLAAAINTNKPLVKIANGLVKDSATTSIDGKAVTILADSGAKLDRDGDGPILEVRSANGDVKIYDLEITGASGVSGADGILVTPNGGAPKLALTRVKITSNQGSGIACNGGALTVSQSTVSSNQGGGISISGTGTMFDVTNNFIVYNGTANGVNATQLGGIAATSNTSGAKLQWNTIAFNQSDGAIYRGGVSCTGAMVSAAGNLIYRNSEADGLGGLKTDANTQRNATGCQFGNSLALATDAANLGLKSPATQPFDFHLTATSPSSVVDAGGSCIGIDFDAQARPIGSACDLGADEFKP
ncbi:MAG: right-handed parallel beta-helix repeat-containing protein [Deltaproteobacteria bacterium]|nr:right-handed parallel beta-helix repeat-containing protein [Deltaproteobacteria bacterium]